MPAKDVVLSPKQRLEKAIEQDPQNIGKYLELADLLSVSNQFNAAETVLTRAIAACGEQQKLSEQLSRVRYLRAEEQRRLDENRVLEQRIIDAPIRFPWLELALGSAIMVLLLQLIPPVRFAAWKILDFREWSQFGWLIFNVLVLLVLIAARFGPDVRSIVRRGWMRRRHRLTKGM